MAVGSLTPEAQPALAEFVDIVSRELGEPLPEGMAARLVARHGEAPEGAAVEQGIAGFGTRRERRQILQQVVIAVLVVVFQPEIESGRDAVVKGLANLQERIEIVLTEMAPELPEHDLTEEELKAALLRSAEEFRRRRTSDTKT